MVQTSTFYHERERRVHLAAGNRVRPLSGAAVRNLALERIKVLRDGRIAYALKVPRKGRIHRIVAPMEFMLRLSALIPRPRIPLVHGHGIFAARSSWRRLVTPKPPAHATKSKPCRRHRMRLRRHPRPRLRCLHLHRRR